MRVAELRERLDNAPLTGCQSQNRQRRGGGAAARISARSVHKLIRDGVLPGTQLMKFAPWQIPIDVLDREVVQIGVRHLAENRPTKASATLDNRLLRLPRL